jgi:NADPH2:quinone reductase
VKAAILREYGQTPEPDEFPVPDEANGAQVVRVAAAGMNPVEIAIASGGFYGFRPELPSIVGREGVGTTADGRRVYFNGCVPPYGSFAEQTLLGERSLAIEIPDRLEDGLAVALGTAGIAAWAPFTRSARLKPGESVLVLGASGVVGQLALQAARLLGAGRIVAAARSPEGLDRAAELGADATLAIGDSFADELTEAAQGGFDVVLDLVWGDAARAAVGSLATWGRLVQVGHAATNELPVTPALLRGRNIELIGFSAAHLPPAELRQTYLTLVDHALGGRLSVEVETYPLEDVVGAWARQLQGPHRKIVVAP